jgi:hypothetical protein
MKLTSQRAQEQHKKIVPKVNELSDLELFIQSDWFKKYRQGTIAHHIKKYDSLSRMEKPENMSMAEYWLHMAKANSLIKILQGLYNTPFSQLKLLNHKINSLGTSESYDKTSGDDNS